MSLFRRKINITSKRLNNLKKSDQTRIYQTSAGDTRLIGNVKTLDQLVKAKKQYTKAKQQRRTGSMGLIRRLSSRRMTKLRFERRKKNLRLTKKITEEEQTKERQIQKVEATLKQISIGKRIVLIDIANRSWVGELTQFEERPGKIWLKTLEGNELHYTYELKDAYEA